MEDLKNTLTTLEKNFWNAAGEGSFYEAHYAKDGMMVLPFVGGILHRQAVIDSVNAANAWKDFRFENVECQMLAPEVALLVYEAYGQREDGEYHAYISSTYAQQDGEWKLAFHQQTPLS